MKEVVIENSNTVSIDEIDSNKFYGARGDSGHKYLWIKYSKKKEEYIALNWREIERYLLCKELPNLDPCDESDHSLKNQIIVSIECCEDRIFEFTTLSKAINWLCE